MVLDRFIAKWTIPGYPPIPVDLAGLNSVEARFQFKLPSDYRTEVVQFGLPQLTISLLHSIVEADLSIEAVSDFLEPAEMIEHTESWRGLGLPSNLVAFATDHSGNLFCFNAADHRMQPPDSQVWLFDHDVETAEAISPSFTAWIERFCGMRSINFEDGQA